MPSARTIRPRWALPATLTAAALVVAISSATGATPAALPRPVADALDVPGSPLDLEAVTFGQQRDRMVLSLTTAGAWRADQLSIAAGRWVCVKLFPGGLPTPRARICVIEKDATAALRYTLLDAAGRVLRVRPLAAVVSRPDARTLQATFAPAAAGLRPGRYAWQAETVWRDDVACVTRAKCTDRAPDAGNVAARIAPPPVAEGCVARGAASRRSGDPHRREVALTFDDGPSRFTPAILRVLEHEHVPATFFVVGSEVRGRRALLQRILRDGSTIGDHTLTHANVAGAGAFAAHQIAATQALIHDASGFEPCLFRPPYGTTSAALTTLVRSLGALSILWSVDPRDWSRPGSAAIAARVVRGARPGSIVLLHDGGGDRRQTVAALPSIIRGLRARRLRIVTVTRLLRLPERSAPDQADAGR